MRILMTGATGLIGRELGKALAARGDTLVCLVRDIGAARRRLKGTAAEGWARLKTGTLKSVTALAGYVRDTRGDTWVVVALLNHEQVAKGAPALDALVEWVAKSGARRR